MRIYDILNPYKLLCESEQILDEALTTDFSIGFELEGVCTKPGFSSYDLPYYHSGRQPSGVVKELFDQIESTLGFTGGKIERDGSLNPSTDRGGWTFEYGSPVIPFNPQNINKIYNFLKQLPSMDVYTNESCGFHTHMSFKGINKANTAWIMCCLAIDNQLREELKELKTKNGAISFISNWSTEETFNTLARYLQRGDYEDAGDVLDSEEKYRLVRVHPAGTMEWRGPRNFLNDGDIDDIHEYIKKVYKIVFGISKIINSKDYTANGITINKKEIESNISIRNSFNSEDQKKLDNKGKNIKERIKLHPQMLINLNKQLFDNLIDEYEYDIRDTFQYNSNMDAVRDTMLKLDPYKLNKIITRIFVNRGDVHRLRTIYLDDDKFNNNKEFLAKLDKSNLKEIFHYYSRSIFTNGGHMPLQYREEFTNFFKIMIEFDRNLFYDDLKKYKNNDYYIEYIKNVGNIIPELLTLDLYKEILNSKHFYLLSQFDNLPVKVQRMMIRKSPYMVQYIKNIDPQILQQLKSKYPDIEQHVLGVI